MDNSRYIAKTRPSVKLFVLGIFGMSFCGWMAYLMFSSNWKVDEKASVFSYVFTYGVMGVFICGAVGGLWIILSFKTYALTANELIVKSPMLFTQRILQLADIESISGEDYDINVADTNKGFFDEDNKTSIYTGRKILIKLKNGKMLELKSFEVTGCQQMADAIKKQRKQLKWEQNHKA